MDIIWVCATAQRAARLRKSFKAPEGIHFTSPESALGGRGADLIILDEWQAVRREEWDWFHTCLLTCLVLHGRVLYAFDLDLG